MKFFAIIFTSALGLLMAGCLESPLFNHADAAVTPIASLSPTNAHGDVAAQDCPLSFDKAGLCASLTWEKMATDEEKGEFTLRFWKKNEATEAGPYVVVPGKLAVKLFMPSMGHGSSPVTITPKLDQTGAAVPGVYSITDVYFIMGGPWEIWVQFKQGTQVLDQVKLPIEI